ncbi:hypothetical protein KIN20_014891 [Parelaphostrongylus tenuis]|uniref:Uncharacterized protein n=1 Tax=Parelaphostrongylus tenuis TaxID=148309 RepID=A0AAD5QS50_PARTN|nr:hypothetical protein KIN20_014891 [Parelaphostrongylus tenuis]
MGALEIVIFNIGMLFSILAHCCAWAIHIQVTRVLERLRNCDENMKSASKLVENSSISEFVMQLSAEQLRFDADVNEFERDVAVLMVKDPQSTYTAETMTRPNKPKITAVENKLGSSNRLPKRKAVRNKGDENEEPETPLLKKEKEEKNQAETKPGTHEKTKEASVEDNDPIKSKFKAPSHITKVDAKDPQYEVISFLFFFSVHFTS